MSIGYQKFYDFQMENENNLFIEFVKAEASRPVWHEMFRLRSYGGKRRAARDLRGARVQTGRGGRLLAARDSGVCVISDSAERECAVTCPLVPRGALPAPTTAGDETESVCGSLFPLSLSVPGIAASNPCSRWLLS